MAIVLGPGLLATVAVVIIAVRLWRDDVRGSGGRPDAVRERQPERVRMMEAAFFDLDKTIIAGSSALVFGRPFMKEGLISRSMIVKGMYAQLVYHLVGADEGKMEKMRVALLELTKGGRRTKCRSWFARRSRRSSTRSSTRRPSS